MQLSSLSLVELNKQTNKQTLFSKEDQRDVKEKIIDLNFLRSFIT